MPLNDRKWVFAIANRLQAARGASVEPNKLAQRTSSKFPPGAALAAANPSITRSKTLVSVNCFTPSFKVLSGGFHAHFVLAYRPFPSMPATAR